MNVFADPVDMPDMARLRAEIRAFLEPALAGRSAVDLARGWSAVDPDFSRALGAQGWIGMVWPPERGGQGAGPLDRYVVVEELLAAGAPVAAHWFADRQSGLMVLRHADPRWCDALLPRMAAGELYFCIGMSEPGAGSDLAAIRTRARPVDDGWRVTGSKIWTSFAHHAHYMIALVRTGDGDTGRHGGLSQMLIDLSAPGILVRPIEDHAGDRHFAEVFLDDVFVPSDMLLGQAGEGWAQVNAELALERSGPERYLSSHRLIEELAGALTPDAPAHLRGLLGGWVAELWCLRRMSLTVAGTLARGDDPMVEAAIVKDLGARFEQALPRELQAVWDDAAIHDGQGRVRAVMDYLLAACPAFSLRGGTREVLRGIIARGLGLR